MIVDPDATRPLKDAPAVLDEHPVGTLVGRYVLLDELGRGGGGRVCVAFDTELERKVALKLLLSGSSLEAARREARALAKLDHPHVVRIFDVGQAADADDEAQPFIAMELMRGSSFEAFCSAAARTEILTALQGVASAIAAAHEANLIHGDIKPSNLLRSAEGHTKLSDFGVARLEQRPATATSGAALAGTRQFLAPECFAGEAVSPASDQYAFCLTAWIALHGRYPWKREHGADATSDANVPVSGSGPEPLRTAEDAKDTGEAPSFDPLALDWDATGLPKGTAAALARGLSPDPKDRWNSMAALCDALEPATPGAGRRVVLGGFALGTMALVAAGVSMANTPPVCEDAGAQMDAIWSSPRRAQIDAHLDGPTYATLRTRVDTVLGAYAEAWTEMSRASCEATHAPRTQSAELLDLRSGCLRHALASFEATTDLLRDGGEDVRLGAHELVEGLTPLAPCADPARLRDAIALPSDPAQRESIFESRAVLERVGVLRIALRFDDAAAALDAVEPAIQRVDHPPLTLELAYARAYLEHARGQNTEAVTRASAALQDAWAIGDTDRARQLAVLLSFVYSTELEQYDSAAIYGDIARGLARRPEATPSERAAAVAVAAMHETIAGNYTEALALQREAIEAHGDTEDVENASLRNDLAIIYHYAGDLQAATAEHEATLALRRRLLGERHPEVAQSLDNLSQVDYDGAHFKAAETLAREARDILLETLPPDHSRVLKNGNTLGNALAGQERWEEALPLIRGAYEGFASQLGEQHPVTAMIRGSLGVVYEELGQTDKALALLAASVQDQIATRGQSHPELILAHASYGAALSRDGQHENALAQLRTAVDVARRTVGLQHDHAVAAFGHLARAELRAGDNAQALMLAEEGLARLEQREPPLPQEAKALASIKAKALALGAAP